MALGNSAGVLFKISADNSDAKRAFNETERDVKGLSGAMGAMGGPAGIATAAIAAVGAAAFGAVVGLTRLTVAASEYGSEIFDASQKANLGAETITTLRFAAEQSGVSFEKITGSVSKFSVLLGQAALGNEKAEKTLAQFNITSTDTQAALEQAITTIAGYSDGNKQAAAAATLFKDKSGDVLNVIKSLKGDLPGAIAELRKMGLVMSNEDAAAADAFGDALDLLSKQAAATGRVFAFELMEPATRAMAAISEAIVNNQGAVAEWARFTVNAATGTALVFTNIAAGIGRALNVITLGLINNQNQWAVWSQGVRVAMDFVLAGIPSLLNAMAMIGASQPQTGSGSGVWLGPMEPQSTPKIPRLGGGGGGGRGGGGGGAATQDTTFADAEKRQQRLLDLYKDGYAQQIAENDNKLAKLEINEQEHLAVLNGLRIAQLEKEKELLEETLTFAKITAEKRIEIEHEIDRLRGQIATQRLENDTAETKRKAKDLEEYNKLVEKFALEQIKIEEAKLKEIERKRAQAADRAAKQFKANQAELNRLASERESLLSGIGGSDSLNPFKRVKESLTTLDPDGTVMQTVGQFAQGIGNLVQQFVLLGSAGPDAMKKMVASVLASVAAQAAVQAIMFTAYGIAALTPWGAAIYGPAAPWFKAAALMAVVAATTGFAGRKVAGDSFSGAAGTATGSGGGNGQGSQQNNFTTQFRGFGSQQTEALNQNRVVMAALEESLTRFDRKVMGMSPGDVVAIAADENPGAFRTGYEGSLSDDYKTTGGFMRQAGLAR